MGLWRTWSKDRCPWLWQGRWNPILKSLNILIGRDQPRILKPNSWPCTEHSKNHTACLRALARLGAVTFLGEPVLVFNHPLGETHFPGIQPEPPLTQLYAINPSKPFCDSPLWNLFWVLTKVSFVSSGVRFLTWGCNCLWICNSLKPCAFSQPLLCYQVPYFLNE